MQKPQLANGGQVAIVADQSRRWNLLLWPMALVFAGATSLPLFDTIAHVLHPPAQARVTWDDYSFLAIIAFVDIGLLGAAGYVTLRSRKFGRSRLELATFPAVVGGELVGNIVTGRPIAFTSPVRVALLCEERRITGNRGGNFSTLWQTEYAINPPPVPLADAGTCIPVHFTIPADCSPTTHENPYIKWRVAVHASMDGVDYYATFPIPVVTASAEDALRVHRDK